MDFMSSIRQTLAATETILRTSIGGIVGPELTQRPAEQEWSIVEVLCHLRDLERDVFPIRIELIRRNDGSTIAGFDENAWLKDRGYAHADPLRALEDFCLARRANLPLVRDILPGELDFSGMHSEFGVLTLRALLADWAGSDLAHSAQIQRIKLWRFYPELGPFQKYFKKSLHIPN